MKIVLYSERGVILNDYNFGNFVCMLREKKGLTQASVAKQLGVTPAAVSKWENGSSKPRTEILFQLAQLLDVKPEELMAGHILSEDTLNPETVKQINERYEYLRRIDSYNSAGVKMRRLIAWILDWNIIGFGVLLCAAILSAFLIPLSQDKNAFVAIFMILVILSYPICFILRDMIIKGRSLGKRIMGLVVLDKQTGEKAKASKCALRNLFVFIVQIDLLVMLITGTSIGDLAANTVVVPKTLLDRPCERDEKYNNDIQKINHYSPARKTSKKNIIILLSSIVLAFALFVGFLLIIINASLEIKTDSEEYQLAYAYLIESQTFKQREGEPEKVKLKSYSINSSKDDNGNAVKTAEFGFDIGSAHIVYVTCHYENGEWKVCEGCTLFE